jgi:hypothetical protein
MSSRVYVLALTLLAGCMTVEVPRPGEALHLDKDHVLVYGRMTASDHGRPIVPKPPPIFEAVSGVDDPRVRLSLFHVENGEKAVFPEVADDGTFWWILPRGTYLVFHTPPGPFEHNEVLAAFQTPPDADAVCVGTLALEVQGDPGTGGFVPYLVSNVDTLDDYDANGTALLARHPDFAGRLAIAAMVADPDLAFLFADYSRARCEKILARHAITPLDR